MLDKVKLALRIKTTAFDDEINDLIAAALADFGEPADFERLKTSYDEQKAQLQMATGYTDWGEDNG